MHHRILNFIAGFAIVLSANGAESSEPSPFEHAALGHCFKSADAFVGEILGGWALTDSNIIKTRKEAWTWVIDQTASKNYTWYLLKENNNEFCFRVYVIAASDVEFKGKNFTKINAIIAPEFGYPSKLIEFKSLSKDAPFKPVNCYILGENYDNKKIIKQKKISCDQVFN